MTPEQTIALNNPCRFAFETAHPRFGRRLHGSARASLVLTVNYGYE